MSNSRFLNDLDVLRVGIVGMMVHLALNSACLNHELRVLRMASGYGIFEGRLPRFTLWRVEIFHFEIGLTIDTVYRTWLLGPLFLIQLLVQVHILE